jgi:hypothetical protein
MPGKDTRLDRADLLLRVLELPEQEGHGRASLVWKAIRCRAGGTLAQLGQAPDALRHDDPEFPQQTPDRVGELGALPDQQGPGPMQGKNRLLIDGLDWHEAHVRPRHRFADRLGIGGIGLVPLDIGLDVLRRDQPDVMP